MTMHILQLGPVPPPEGGVSRNMLAIRDELVAGGDSCSIIATTSGGNASDEEVYRPTSATELIRMLRTLDYDLLHLHIGGEVSLRVTALAAAAALLGRTPSVLTLHSGGFPTSDKGRNARAVSLRGSLFRRFKHVIAVNEQMQEMFGRFGVRAERCSVIPPHSSPVIDDSIVLNDQMRQFYASHSPVILAVGGLEKEYDPLFQIEAFTEALKQFPNAGLVMVGDGSMRSEVEKAVAESGSAEHIRVAGNTAHAETLHMIRDADVLLRTTHYDGDAIAIREALHFGTPVIATNVGDRPDGVNLVEIGDKAGLIGELQVVVKNGKRQDPAPPNNTNIRRVIDIYQQILNLP